MRVLRELDVPCRGHVARLQICEGDLANVSPGFETDLLGLSAFDGDYAKTATSVIGQLYFKRQVDVAVLKQQNAEFLQSRHCWMSQPLTGGNSGLGFNRIICTETPRGKSARHAAGYLFIALSPFLMKNPNLRSISVPILGSGDQRYPKKDGLIFLIKEAVSCLKGGLGLDLFRIVVRASDSLDAASWFDEMKQSDPEIQAAYDTVPVYDAFISYSRVNFASMLPFYERLKSLGLQPFMDKSSLEPGDVWGEKLDIAIARSKVFVALISDEFNNSIYCQQEADHALRLSGLGAPKLFPIRIADIPPPEGLAKFHAPLLDDTPPEENSFNSLCDWIARAAGATSLGNAVT